MNDYPALKRLASTFRILGWLGAISTVALVPMLQPLLAVACLLETIICFAIPAGIQLGIDMKAELTGIRAELAAARRTKPSERSVRQTVDPSAANAIERGQAQDRPARRAAPTAVTEELDDDIADALGL